MKLCRQFCLQKIVKTKEVKNKMIAYLLQCHLKDYKNVHARTSKPCSGLGVIQQLPGLDKILSNFDPSPLPLSGQLWTLYMMPTIQVTKYGLSTDPLTPSSCPRSY